MKLSFALNSAFALGLMGSSSAFTLPGAFLRAQTRVHIGASGWDNDDFLDSLSRPDETTPPTPEEPADTMPPVTPRTEADEIGPGGTRFREMMEKAKDAGRHSAVPNYPAPMNPFANVIPPPPNQEPPLAAPNMENMSVEDQAAMFRQMMAMSGQQQPQDSPMPVKNFGPQGLDAKGRKIGRNKDADTIANTSDLYLAQLKRDSSVRTVARYSGDEEFAEKVFEDAGVHELEATYQVNPYLKEERDKEQELFKAATEEMKIFQQAQQRKAPNMKDTGPKYKELLAKKKGVAAAKKTAPVVPAPAPFVEAPAPVVPAPTPVVQDPAPVPVVAQTPAPVESSEPVTETEQTRRKLRELQGLFLKHRGGPGFGSGRLRTKEVEQFEAVLKEVGATLRTEAGAQTADAPAAAGQIATPSPVPYVIIPPAPTKAELNKAVNMEATLSCVEGAAQMYRNSPKELQGSILPALRAALVSAATSCSRVIEGAVDQSSSKVVPIAPGTAPEVIVPPAPTGSDMTAFQTGSADPRMEGTLACVEGAAQMYKNSPPELKMSILPALRAALMSAANSCTQVIEGTVDQTSYTRPAAANVSPRAGNIADADIEETGENPAATVAAASTQAPTGNDSNTALLQKVHDALDEASGEGKFGVGPISSDEAGDLAELVHEMRAVLMEELDTGIPNDGPAVSTEADDGSSTTSMYAQMLAKARAAKEDK